MLVHQARFVLLVMFAGVFGDGQTTVDGVRIDTARFFVPGILTMSIVTAAYTAARQVSMSRR